MTAREISNFLGAWPELEHQFFGIEHLSATLQNDIFSSVENFKQ